MADRRMFAQSITESDAFLDMPLSTQALYFHLGMTADDDGFVGSPKRIMRSIGASNDELMMLVSKGFVIAFESGVVVIKHWKINNYIREDRKRDTNYYEELKQLTVNDNGSYSFVPLTCDCNQLPTTCQPTDNQVTGKCLLSIGEDRIGKDRIGKDKGESEAKRKRFTRPSIEEVNSYVSEKGYSVDAESFIAYYDSVGWKVGNKPMKDWRAAVVTWERRNKTASTQCTQREEAGYDEEAMRLINQLSAS